MSDYLDKIKVGSTTYDIKDSNAYVLPSTGIPSSDLAVGVIPIVPTAYDTAAQALGTASAGTSTSWARGDHIHPMPSASDVGAVIAPASASSDNVLAYNGSAWVADKRMVILSYGHSTWAEFLSAYHANAVIYCRASSNANPGSGSQTRMAFMAYVNNADNPTNVEFQYYRSVNSHSVTQQGDQVYVYKLDKTAGWTVTVRESYTKINVSTGLASSYSNSALTITNPAAVPTGGTTGQALVKTSNSNYALAWQTIDAGHSIPSGGLNGQVLAKSSDDDYEVAWTTIPAIPSVGGMKGYFLQTNPSTGALQWGNTKLHVNFNKNFQTSVYTCDKTFGEICDWYPDDKYIIGHDTQSDGGVYYLDFCDGTNPIVFSRVSKKFDDVAGIDKLCRETFTIFPNNNVSHQTFFEETPIEFVFDWDPNENEYVFRNSSYGDVSNVANFFWGISTSANSTGTATLRLCDENGTFDTIAQLVDRTKDYETIDDESILVGRAQFVATKTIYGNANTWQLRITQFEMAYDIFGGVFIGNLNYIQGSVNLSNVINHIGI